MLPFARTLLFFCLCAVAVPFAARPQNLADPPEAAPAQSFVSPLTSSGYTPPSESDKLHNYLYEAFGPYPLIMSAIVSGYHQARRNPPDWREGLPGYGARYASDFGISVVNVSTRYTLAEAMNQDVYYYRCSCKGVWPRLKHAVASTVIARNQIDGRSVFALPSVVAPYAGPLVATQVWYPPRYGPKDAFRMGNYGLLDFTIGNIGLEFLPGLLHPKADSWINRFHLNNRHGARLAPSAP